MLDSLLRYPRAALGALRGSQRSVFWTSFVISLAVSICWILATPIFASPDEPKHAIRAASVARLEILGHEDPRIADELVVDAPRGYKRMERSIACYAFLADVPASCAHLSDDTEIVPLATGAGRHTPAYYFVAGLPSLLLRTSDSIYLMRLVSALITAGFVATSIASLRRLRDARAASVGLAVALTPLVWFVSAAVNPSASEIAAGIALWSCGGVLALQAPDEVDPVLVRRAGIAAVVLALSRQLGPGWVVVILGVLAMIAGRAGVRRLMTTTAARFWALAAAAASASTLAWDIVVRPVQPRASEMLHVSTLEAAQNSLQDSFNRYKELVGWFGWLDTPPTATMVTIFTIALVGLALASIAIGRRRLCLLGFAVAVATVATPVVFEAFEAHDLGYFWQSRYTLPLAVGAPILLGLSVSERTRPRERLVAGLTITIPLLMGVLQVLGFAQALLRNTVGYHEPLGALLRPIWQPPLPPWFLLGSTAVAVAILMYWLVGRGPTDATATGDPTGVDNSTTALI